MQPNLNIIITRSDYVALNITIIFQRYGYFRPRSTRRHRRNHFAVVFHIRFFQIKPRRIQRSVQRCRKPACVVEIERHIRIRPVDIFISFIQSRRNGFCGTRVFGFRIRAEIQEVCVIVIVAFVCRRRKRIFNVRSCVVERFFLFACKRFYVRAKRRTVKSKHVVRICRIVGCQAHGFFVACRERGEVYAVAKRRRDTCRNLCATFANDGYFAIFYGNYVSIRRNVVYVQIRGFGYVVRQRNDIADFRHFVALVEFVRFAVERAFYKAFQNGGVVCVFARIECRAGYVRNASCVFVDIVAVRKACVYVGFAVHIIRETRIFFRVAGGGYAVHCRHNAVAVVLVFKRRYFHIQEIRVVVGGVIRFQRCHYVVVCFDIVCRQHFRGND